MAVIVSIISGFHEISASLFHIVLLLMENTQCVQCMLAGKAALLRREDAWKQWTDLRIRLITETQKLLRKIQSCFFVCLFFFKFSSTMKKDYCKFSSGNERLAMSL